ncbi:MAG: glycosyltransferase family 4 protein [Planctomycetaceae bacterium]
MRIFSGRELSAGEFVLIAGGCSVVAALLGSLLAGWAGRFRLVSRHRRERFGVGRVPLTGGPGLLCGMLAPVAALGLPLAPGEWVGLGGFFLVGLIDDARELRPLAKGLLQLTVACTASWLLVPSLLHFGVAVLLFLFLVNASNYLDNMDALLPGVALAQATVLALLGTRAGVGATLLLWSLPGILLLNLPPARVFLGDSGSHLVGALFAIDAIALLLPAEGARPRFLLPLALLFAVPIADAATVTLSRLRRGRPLFRGGTDHLSHRLARLGFPVPRAVLLLVLAAAVCGAAALLVAHA